MKLRDATDRPHDPGEDGRGTPGRERPTVSGGPTSLTSPAASSRPQQGGPTESPPGGASPSSRPITAARRGSRGPIGELEADGRITLTHGRTTRGPFRYRVSVRKVWANRLRRGVCRTFGHDLTPWELERTAEGLPYWTRECRRCTHGAVSLSRPADE